ncbi:hypothetical protein FOMPIDRAFT_62548 [Fomitopsis schrenkii]|uniref:Reverse transcriptase zinc-binding domain-containing protein n=1 Tax=Fomitopsis schrenkii TaxID=2126942 RepID=S8DS59_FOMSC|nr:hypothetical protein FOMPIDRAFT_62548 [Fomitopsis schrenkii]
MITAIRGHLRLIPDAESDEQDIWRGLRHKDLRRPVVDFLWKGIHRAHRIGQFWLKIPGHEDRAVCEWCNEQDSLEHILLQCSAVGQSTVWDLAKAAWNRKNSSWVPLKLHDLLAIGPRSRVLMPGKPTAGHLARFWRILISESAYLIWKLRCERVIGRSEDNHWQHKTANVRACWLSTMNSRLRQDATGTSHKFGRLALEKNLVIKTWEYVIKGEDMISTDWTSQKRVLVGIDPELAREPEPGDHRVPH